MSIGIDFHDQGVVALLVDERGAVQVRESRAGTTAAEASAAVAALSGAGVPRGVAVRDRAAADAAGLLAAVSQDSASPRVITRGTAVALAEQWCGAAAGAGLVVALTATDCVHAGVVVQGRPFEGAHGMAGSAAWLALNPVEREDYRRLGCLEAEIGAGGIVRRLVWRVKAGDHSRVVEMAGGSLADIDVHDVFEAARGGDGVAISVVRDTAKYVGMAIANLAAIVDPDVVVLGGVIAGAADLLLEPARAEVSRRMNSTLAAALTIVPAALGDDAAAIGAARAATLPR